MSLTKFTEVALPSLKTRTPEAIVLVNTCAAILTRIAGAFRRIHFASFTGKTRRAGTGKLVDEVGTLTVDAWATGTFIDVYGNNIVTLGHLKTYFIAF